MRWLLVLAALVSSPALADMTAIYAAPGSKFTMTVEIASNGDLHGDVAGQAGTSFTTRGGHGYFIQTTPSGPIVMHVEDMATVTAEQVQKLDPAFRQHFGQGPSLSFVDKGTVTVNGRTGTAYFAQKADGRLSSRPWVVISKDPALAPLAKAMSAQFDMSTLMMSQIAGTAAVKPMQDVLKTGAPLVFTGAELQSVNDDPIPASHFELPAQPASLDEVRKQMSPAAVKP